VRGELRDRTGLVVGMNHVSPESHAALQRTIDERGLRYLSATMFSRMVLNATTGACSKALALRGPCSTLSAGRASGLAAVVYAAHLLAQRDDADHIVAGSVEELDAEPRPGTSEGAGCIVLGVAPPPGSCVRFAGWAIGGPRGTDDTDAAVRAALAMAGCSARDLDLVIGPPLAGLEVARWLSPAALFGDAGAATSSLALAAGIALLRRGDARCALVFAEPDESTTCAVVIAREEGRPHG
jgi:3-oxoacyl-(acyl-carrier-protein) synthase